MIKNICCFNIEYYKESTISICGADALKSFAEHAWFQKDSSENYPTKVLVQADIDSINIDSESNYEKIKQALKNKTCFDIKSFSYFIIS